MRGELYRPTDPCTHPRWAGDHDLDAVSRPNMFSRAQPKRVAIDVAVDVGKKIFVCRDTEGSRSILPLDFETTACANVGKGVNRAFISFDIAVAPDPYPPATGE